MRINAWSEITALVAPFAIYPIVKSVLKVEFPESLLIIVAGSTVAWLAVTFMTRPTSEEVLLAFYRRVHPGGFLWKPIADRLPDVKSDRGYWALLIDWLAGVACVMLCLFSVGNLIFGQTTLGLLLFGGAVVLGSLIYRRLSRMTWDDWSDR